MNHEIDPSLHVRNTHQQPYLSALPVLASAMLASQKSIRHYVKSRDPSLHPLSTHDSEGVPVAQDITAAGVVCTLLDALDQALIAFEKTAPTTDIWPATHDEMPY